MGLNKLLLGIIVLILNLTIVFSIDYNCVGNIDLGNYNITNEINITDRCYGIEFIGKDLNEHIDFHLNNINYNNQLITFYDNTPETIYQNSSSYVSEFNFENFDYVKFKYGSEYPLVTSNYINRNKFVGTQTTNAEVFIENSVKSGQQYFISGSLSNFNNIDLYFENFGVDNEMGEYRIFLNDINNVDVYIDCGGGFLNEKILIVTNNINNIQLHHNMENDESFDDYRIKIITFEEFMSYGLDKIYLTNAPIDTIDIMNEEIVSSDIDFIEDYTFTQRLSNSVVEVYEENKTPFSLYVLAFILVFLITIITIGQDKILSYNKKDIYKHMSISIIPVIFLLVLTKNPIATFVTSLVISTSMSLYHFRDIITKDRIIKYIKYMGIVLFIMILVILYYLWKGGQM